jgi:hypothetical protein
LSYGQEGGWWDCVFRVNRNRCQFCRLQKCLALGMSRDGEFIHSTSCSFIHSFIHLLQALPQSSDNVLYHSIISYVTDVIHTVTFPCIFKHLFIHLFFLSFIHSFCIVQSFIFASLYVISQPDVHSFPHSYLFSSPHTHTNSHQNFDINWRECLERVERFSFK